jgi:twitching motility two-component system response regulator PilG
MDLWKAGVLYYDSDSGYNWMVERIRKKDTSMSKLVMVIDDSPTVRKIVETCLRREGFEVIGFSDGVEAMRWLMEPQSRVPDLVLLDIGLPKMDGYEVARRLKSKPQFGNTVIVMLSRRDGVIDRLKGRLAGAREYISKPFKTQELISVVESYLGTPSADQGYGIDPAHYPTR